MKRGRPAIASACLCLVVMTAPATPLLVEPGVPSFNPPPPPARILRVGATRPFKRPSDAAAVAKAGDVIEIDPEIYRGDVAAWWPDRITLRGATVAGTGARARLLADGRNAEGKAIWVIKGDDVRVENIEFAGAAGPNGNGAGIREEGSNLTVVNCDFHDNQEGILTAIYTPDSTIDIENSIFARDGGDGGYAHEIYIGNIVQLIVRGSYFHQGNLGHLIKSRARANLIEANRITDEDGRASYEIDLPNGGLSIIRANMIEKGPHAENPNFISYAREGASNPQQTLYVINNSFVNHFGWGAFVTMAEAATATIANNIFVGGGNVLQGNGVLSHNLLAAGKGGAPIVERTLFTPRQLDERDDRFSHDPGFVDIDRFDYRITAKSAAIGIGVDPGAAEGKPLTPALAYAQPVGSRRISAGSPIDAGAFQH